MKSGRTIILKNSHLVAHFSNQTGHLTHLSSEGRGRGVIGQTFLRYYDMQARTWHTQEEGGKGTDDFVLERFQSTATSVRATLRNRHIEVAVGYRLPAASPLLEVTTRVRGLGPKAELVYMAAPTFKFAPDFVDAFEDHQDLYFDGAELGGGRELPCWRVFFRKGHQSGLILLTRCKRAMAHVEIKADRFEHVPHTRFNYSTAIFSQRTPFNPALRGDHEGRLEIGPWTPAAHRGLLRTAGADRARRFPCAPARGAPPRRLKGVVIPALRCVGAAEAGRTYSPERWLVADMPWARRGRALFANAGVKPPPLRLDPRLKGLHRVHVGIGNGAGVALRATGDPETRFRMASHVKEGMETPFELALAGRHRAGEVSFGVFRMDGLKLSLMRFPDLHLPCVIDYVRFEKLTPAEARRWEAEERAEPILPLSGLSDVPDIAPLTDARDPDVRAYAANIWEHANCKVGTIYWRIDGQCSDYPSKVNTMRYISAKVHGVFHPQSKAYGRALRKVDMLRLAVDAARTHGVRLYGWMRFNNYSGNVQSDFYKNNPPLREEWESGYPAPKLCLAHPEVRRHKIDILTEAAGYGLDGLCLGFLRHPPVLLYAPVLVQGFKRKFGRLPPRDRTAQDSTCVHRLPPMDPAHVAWYRYRAQFLTRFGRELKAALKAKGLGHVKIAIWVRPNHCLFDGIDMETWLDEGLCDEVVSQAYHVSEHGPAALHADRPAWKRMVRAKAKLIRSVPMDVKLARPMLRQAIREGYDGLCNYESDYTVIESEFIELYRSLRRPARDVRA